MNFKFALIVSAFYLAAPSAFAYCITNENPAPGEDTVVCFPDPQPLIPFTNPLAPPTVPDPGLRGGPIRPGAFPTFPFTPATPPPIDPRSCPSGQAYDSLLGRCLPKDPPTGCYPPILDSADWGPDGKYTFYGLGSDEDIWKSRAQFAGASADDFFKALSDLTQNTTMIAAVGKKASSLLGLGNSIGMGFGTLGTVLSTEYMMLEQKYKAFGNGDGIRVLVEENRHLYMGGTANLVIEHYTIYTRLSHILIGTFQVDRWFDGGGALVGQVADVQAADPNSGSQDVCTNP